VRSAHELVGAGSFSFAAGETAISYQIECGLLRATHVDGAEFTPVLPVLPRDLSEIFAVPTFAAAAAPIAAEHIDEILCIARHARTSAVAHEPVTAA
jgi:hypothetical protein